VTNPTLPGLIGLVLTGDAKGLAPTNLPRTDLATMISTTASGTGLPVRSVTLNCSEAATLALWNKAATRLAINADFTRIRRSDWRVQAPQKSGRDQNAKMNHGATR
jgi:hypothetical protein